MFGLALVLSKAIKLVVVDPVIPIEAPRSPALETVPPC
jgi:hypothetical protein